jgi:phospholipase/lecithinase/hemolysin
MAARKLPCLVLFVVLSLAVPAVAQDVSPDFFNLVVLGDSLSAGFISGGWNASGQNNSYVAHLARHLPTFVFQPLIAEPGIPAELQLVRPTFPFEVAPKPGTSSGRVAPFVLPTNLAVPGANVSSALRDRPTLPIDTALDLVLGIPGLVIPGSVPVSSQVEMAELLRPSVALVWLGSNDALAAATGGTPSQLTGLESFTSDYRAIVSRLRATGARLILLNIPDVTVIPALMSIPAAAQLTGLPASIITARLGVAESDFLLLSHVLAYAAKLTGLSSAPLADSQVLTAAEVTQIRQRVKEFNDAIRTIAAENQAILVDINASLAQLAANGISIGSRRLGTGLLGGLFSLDGVHPTYTGQAWIANEIVSTLNRMLGLNIPPINLAAVMASDPLVF